MRGRVGVRVWRVDGMGENNSKEEAEAKPADGQPPDPSADAKRNGGRTVPLKPAMCECSTQTEPDEEGYDMKNQRNRRSLFCRQLYTTAQEGERAMIEEGRLQRCKICCSMCLVNLYYVCMHR